MSPVTLGPAGPMWAVRGKGLLSMGETILPLALMGGEAPRSSPSGQCLEHGVLGTALYLWAKYNVGWEQTPPHGAVESFKMTIWLIL